MAADHRGGWTICGLRPCHPVSRNRRGKPTGTIGVGIRSLTREALKIRDEIRSNYSLFGRLRMRSPGPFPAFFANICAVHHLDLLGWEFQGIA
jgi:hypothetical protein